MEAFGVQIQSSEIEVNCMGKPLCVSESTRTNFNGFDAAIYAFSWAITNF